MVRGASLARGAGWAGIGSSGLTSVGGGSLIGVFVPATMDPLLLLDFVPAELVAQRREHLRAVGVLLAGPEAGQER